MKQRKVLISAAVIGVLAVAWYLFRPELLFIDKQVNEAFPTAAAAPKSSQPGAMPIESKPVISGSFHSGAHETSGMAAIYDMTDGKRVLRLTNFKTSNGPDVHVYLVAAEDAKDDATVKSAGFIDLGSMKGNIGDQNYDLPANVDLSKYRAATIWCARFSVNFGTAPLSAMGMTKTAPTATAEMAMAGEPAPTAEGMFHSGAHETSGTAAIYTLADGKRILRLTNFKTSNGPDVHVYLVAAPDAKDDETVKKAGFVDLGSMKGNIGDQNYDIPAEVDLAKHQAVTIWCARLNVNFGTAPLTAMPSKSSMSMAELPR